MTDTRKQILHTIRDQAKLLAKGAQQEPLVHVWSLQQWWEAFQFLFVNFVHGADSSHHDDLLFFVKSPSHPSANSPPFFVRRKAKQLPAELQLSGKEFGNVDWPQTVLLNIVLQSQYQLTVVACGQESLPFVAEGRTWASNMITVSKPVYASTSITAVNLDSSRAEASNPQPCYPDICFAVDNFDNAFEDLVLEDADKCYCVVLHAILDHWDTAGVEQYPELEAVSSRISSSTQASSSTAAQGSSSQPQQQHVHHSSSSSSNGSNRAAALAVAAPSGPVAGSAGADGSGAGADDNSPLSWQIGTQARRRTLFAGYVSFGQIVDFMETSGRSKGTILDALRGSKAAQQDKVVMTGPGGVGRCEVAVTKLMQASRSNTPGGSSHGGGTAGAEFPGSDGSSSSNAANGVASLPQQQQGSLLQRGLQRARMLASGVQQALSDVGSGNEPCTMMCAMMLMKLPVQYLVHELLEAI